MVKVCNQDVLEAVCRVDELRTHRKISDDDYRVIMPVVDSAYNPNEKEEDLD